MAGLLGRAKARLVLTALFIVRQCQRRPTWKVGDVLARFVGGDRGTWLTIPPEVAIVVPLIVNRLGANPAGPTLGTPGSGRR